MRVVVFLILLVLTACASPDRRYWGAESQTVTIAGRDYNVYRRQNGSRISVQVIRMGYARRREHVAILGAMRVAAEQATGCRVIEGSADGDSGVMDFRMRCPRGQA
ncbi:hypothetical protein JI664_12460 [Rhodobacter sp. NTK016B]|uniref:hypothetical protein n=2 Tax=Bacteria TaxID=2 RepID=UPI001A8FD076|nr:hypothetical protein [Rhodobacter sp. NTK016B]MBN8292778.1 hypothetical protein [Rhodobacter sp. NTK016B]